MGGSTVKIKSVPPSLKLKAYINFSFLNGSPIIFTPLDKVKNKNIVRKLFYIT